MIAFRHLETGEVVIDFDAANRPATQWESLGEVPAGIHPTLVVVGALGALSADMSAVDRDLQAKIDREAGEFRKNFITDVPGQQATYVEKEREARVFLNDPAAPGLLLLTAEATARGISAAEMATLIVTIADQWKPLNARIEAARIKAKAEVASATSQADKESAATVDWWALVA